MSAVVGSRPCGDEMAAIVLFSAVAWNQVYGTFRVLIFVFSGEMISSYFYQDRMISALLFLFSFSEIVLMNSLKILNIQINIQLKIYNNWNFLLILELLFFEAPKTQ